MKSFKSILYWLGAAALIAAAYRAFEWRGVAIAVSGMVFWFLLHWTRMMQILKRAVKRPVGYVDSAVMFNAKLKPKWSLLQVIALAHSFGQRQTEQCAQPEVFRWSDGGHSYVECSFIQGKLSHWQLVRPTDLEPTSQSAITSAESNGA